MAHLIYYRMDGDEEKGPLDEKTVLDLYNGAEFTSDVSFQIRSSESDRAAPFVQLRDLISKNGPSNPFRDDFSDLDKRIEEAEKELAELRTVASKRSELEEKVAEIERNLAAEKKKRGVTGGETEEDEGAYRRYLHAKEENEPLCKCSSCDLMLANWKQCLMHVNQSCPDAIPSDVRKEFKDDYERWVAEDADRLSRGRRLFSRMTSDETGNARPQTDFFEGVNEKLMRDMALSTQAGRTRSIEFLKSDAAKKIKTRLEKHLKEANGKLVCKQCEVACTTSDHFIIHLTTYDHRMKVRETSLELISLVLGWFNRGLYLEKADPSEIEEVVVPEQEMNSLRVKGDDVWTRTEVNWSGSREGREGDQSDSSTHSHDFEEYECDGDGMMCGMMDMIHHPIDQARIQKEQLIHMFSLQTIICCTECDAMYTNFKQFLVHVASDQHVENVRKVKQSREEAEKDKIDHEELMESLRSDLQKWRWSDRVGLAGGKKIYEGLSEEERREARPNEKFMMELNRKLGMKIKKKANGKYEEYSIVAEEYLVTDEGKNLLDGLEKHLKEKKMFVCTLCKYGIKDLDSFYIHCMTYDHVRITQGSMCELATVLIGIHKKDLYM